MKKQDNEYTCIIPLLKKKIFRTHFKVLFPKFVDTANKNIFSISQYNYVCLFLFVDVFCMFYTCNLCFICIKKSVFVLYLLGDIEFLKV